MKPSIRRTTTIAAALLAVALLAAIPFAWDRMGQRIVLVATCDGVPMPTATCVAYPAEPTDDIVMFRRLSPGNAFETTIGGPRAIGAERIAYCMDEARWAAMRLRSAKPAITATLDVCDGARSTGDAEVAQRLTADDYAALQAGRRASQSRRSSP